MKSIDSLPKTTFSGRKFTRKQLARVQETVATFSNLSRKELALTVCEHLDWKTPKGTLKVQSALTLLEALETHDVIVLPSKRVTKSPVRQVPTFDQPPDRSAVQGPLAGISPISLRPVITQHDRRRWKAYLQAYHYLGYKHPFGDHLGYFIVSEPRQQELGCFVFSASAARAMAPRDEWIGWQEKQRKKHLSLILSNNRFLIFPWVEVPNLASHALALATQQIAEDWQRHHGYRPALIETFVDPTRYSGTCYRAANWHYVGQTQGRGHDDRRHDHSKTKKEIYVYPLQKDWKRCLLQGHPDVDQKKRYRKDRESSATPWVGDAFLALWHNVVKILHEVATEYDETWRVRKRLIDSLMLMLMIFRLVSSKSSQSYGTTIDDLWNSYGQLKLPLPQKKSIAPSSFCAARKKLNESIFQDANHRILQAYAPQAGSYAWRGHRLFAVDGSKITLPRKLIDWGYRLANDQTHYPQGLLSCLYEIRSRLPFDFELVSHHDERKCARKHLGALKDNDVVVYDRGYFSYEMLYQHHQRGIHAIFRLPNSSYTVIQKFLASGQTERVVEIFPSPRARQDIAKRYPDLDIVPLKMRLLKYQISDTTYCLGTTLVDVHQRYPLEDFIEVYHSRWGVEELYKVSKRLLTIEDFHAKTERGVKQEIYAHFVLITMNRLFANQADLELNKSDLDTSSHEPTEKGPSTETTRPRIQTNFKNCIHVVARSLEQLLLLQDQMKTAVQRVFATVVSRYQKIRPGRSYPRKTLRPDPRWQVTKKKRKRNKRVSVLSASV